LQRPDYGRHEVRATADRFRQDHVGPPIGAQVGDGLRQRIEIAAEARTGNFAHLKPLRPQAMCIDQVRGLIVGDDPNPFPLALEMAGEPADRGRLTRPQKTPEHDETNG
jgi:hypothetical protein